MILAPPAGSLAACHQLLFYTPLLRSFTPHLMPMTRGMESACYVKLANGATAADLRKHLQVGTCVLIHKGGWAAWGPACGLLLGLHGCWAARGLASDLLLPLHGCWRPCACITCRGSQLSCEMCPSSTLCFLPPVPQERYQDETFVHVLPAGQVPQVSRGLGVRAGRSRPGPAKRCGWAGCAFHGGRAEHALRCLHSGAAQ